MPAAALRNQRAYGPCKVPYAKRTNDATGVEGMGGVDYAAHEASLEAKASEGSRTDSGSRRRVFVASGRFIRSNRCAGGRCTAVGYLPAPNHSQ
jgi:hypothetical protein